MLTTPQAFRKHLPMTLAGLLVLIGTTPNATAQCQLQKLLTTDGATGESFGNSVAVSGDTALIGAPRDDDRGVFSGSAYVFERIAGVWTQTAKLIAADGMARDEFGGSVALSGDTAVIGAPSVDDREQDSGSAYVFEKVAGVWTQTGKLNAADGANRDRFGNSVALSGDTAVIGASLDDDLGFDSGSAYVFERIAGVWTQTAKLTAADRATNDRFGVSVALSGGTALIGALFGNGSVRDSGSTYVFEKVAGVWTQTTKLIAADGAANDGFGISVALSGDTAVIGALSDDDACLPGFVNCNSGSTYVFEKVAGVWTQTAKLTAADGATGDQFGNSVAVSGGTAIVGAFRNDFDSGSAYIFVLSGNDCNNNGIGDACDIANGTSTDCNSNRIPDDCETDSDGDGVIDDCDACPLDSPDDTDGDGVCDTDDLCSDTSLGLLVGLDGCTLTEGPCCFSASVCIDGNDRQTCEAFPGGVFQGEGLTCGDPDGDGRVGCSDGCPLDPAKTHPGVCGCGVPDDDEDFDGIADCDDRCLQTPFDTPVNVCGCEETGACCAAAGGCFDDIERSLCRVIAGFYQGDGSTCAGGCGFGDLDGDGDVDLADFGTFERCFTGSAAQGTPSCAGFDVDGCGNIDRSDFQTFRRAMTGP